MLIESLDRLVLWFDWVSGSIESRVSRNMELIDKSEELVDRLLKVKLEGLHGKNTGSLAY